MSFNGKTEGAFVMHRGAVEMAAGLAALVQAGYGWLEQHNSTYYNPILPGFHPDPSCIFVQEWDNTFFCASSSFIAWPAMPIHISKDLVNWKLVSHVQNRPSQFPGAGNITRGSGGWYAPTLRYHEGTFYVINVDVDAPSSGTGIFTTTNPYDNDAWSNLLEVKIPGYDPDIFWDTNGTIFSQCAHTVLGNPFTTDIERFTIELPSGETSTPYYLTNGTGLQPPEGPHMYFKDGYYWLLLAEGGTALGHQADIFRSKNPSGPWESDPRNPALTATNTSSLFQTVGHADLFEDANGNWWGVALTTRSGPAYINWPMNRETVLYPVSWPEGEWPILERVSGEMSGPLPPPNRNLPGTGTFVKDPDYYNFPPGSTLPRHFTFWRFPKTQNYVISPPSHANTLQLTPSNANLSQFPSFNPLDGQTFVGRRQTDTIYVFDIDMRFAPTKQGEEAGVTMFLTQDMHTDLGVVYLDGLPHLRFRAEGPNAPATVTKRIPQSWCENEGIHFEIKGYNFTHYAMAAGAAGQVLKIFAYVNNSILSTSFTGAFAGIYATTNGHGEGGTPLYFSNWRYQGEGQAIGIAANGDIEYVPSVGQNKWGSWWWC